MEYKNENQNNEARMNCSQCQTKKLDYLKLAVTYRCNLNCRFCQQQKEKKVDMGWDCFKNIVDSRDITENLRLILFTGGEPLIWPYLDDAIKFSKQKGVKEIGIFTNGILLDENRIKELKGAGTDWMRISLYGSNPYINDGFLDNQKSFDKIINSLELLKKYDYRRKVRVTIMKSNVRDITNIIEKMDDLGVEELDFRTYNPTLNPDANREFELSNRDIGEVIPKILDYKNKISKMEIKLLPGCYDFLFGKNLPEDASKTAKCSCGRSYLGVTAEGDVRVCFGVHGNIGNVGKDKIKDIWENNDLLKKIKKFETADECAGCIFTSHCKSSDCFAITYNKYGDINHKNPLCPLESPVKSEEEWIKWKKKNSIQ